MDNFNINGVHYFIKNEEKIENDKEYDILKKWIYINMIINKNQQPIEKIDIILKDIIYNIKTVNNSDLIIKKKIMEFIPTKFLKYKKYNNIYPNIL
jgi:hypothetical protein